MSHESRPPNSDIEAVTAALDALPLTGKSRELGSRATIVARFYIRRHDPGLHQGIQDKLNDIHGELIEGLCEYMDADGNYVLPPSALRAITARGVSAGAAVVAVAIGTSLGEIHELEANFNPSHQEGPEPGQALPPDAA